MQRTLIGAWVMMIVFPDEQRRGFASMQHAMCYASCAPVNTAAGGGRIRSSAAGTPELYPGYIPRWVRALLYRLASNTAVLCVLLAVLLEVVVPVSRV